MNPKLFVVVACILPVLWLRIVFRSQYVDALREGVTFCSSPFCLGYVGTILCEQDDCPIDGIAVCSWDSVEWHCTANLNSGEKIVDPKVLCIYYGTLVDQSSCSLSYNTQPANQYVIHHQYAMSATSLFLPVFALLFGYGIHF